MRDKKLLITPILDKPRRNETRPGGDKARAPPGR
jgi:hypothetical protein